MSKHSIMLCDDQPRFIQEFIERHGTYYSVQSVNDTRDLLQELEKQPTLPDLLLLDLYHPLNSDADFEERRLEAEKSLSALDAQIELTKQAVLRTWEPHGLDMLEEIRRKYSATQLPVAIFTQKGLLLLDDDQLRRVEQLEAHWLLKKRLSARTEEVRIDRIIDYYEKQRAKDSKQVFIIHGHDNENLVRLRDILSNRFGLQPIILKDLPGLGKTIIGKLEETAQNAAFAIALLTPDDFVKSGEKEYPQARPNVLFEIGYFYGLLGRNKVCIVCDAITAIPSDLHGVSKINFKSSVQEIVDELEKELRAVGLMK